MLNFYITYVIFAVYVHLIMKELFYGINVIVFGCTVEVNFTSGHCKDIKPRNLKYEDFDD